MDTKKITKAETAIKDRALRGLDLYRERCAEIVARPAGGYSVPSASTPGRTYRVDLVSGRCGCPDHRRRRTSCLHIFAATVFEAHEACRRSKTSAPKIVRH
jgi:hypothetical protein